MVTDQKKPPEKSNRGKARRDLDDARDRLQRALDSEATRRGRKRTGKNGPDGDEKGEK